MVKWSNIIFIENSSIFKDLGVGELEWESEEEEVWDWNDDLEMDLKNEIEKAELLDQIDF